jgi:hypothetical protein
MTVAGIVVDYRGAYIWADTAVSDEKGFVAHRPKLKVNCLAGLVGVTVGWNSIGERAEAALLCSETLDDALRRVPRAMRSAALKLIDRPRGERAIGGTAFLLAGFDRGHPVAYSIAGEKFFEAERVRYVAHPTIDDLDSLDGREPYTLIGVAQTQIARHCSLRDRYPEGNVLTVAVLSSAGIVAGPVFDLTAGTVLGSSLSPPPTVLREFLPSTPHRREGESTA